MKKRLLLLFSIFILALAFSTCALATEANINAASQDDISNAITSASDGNIINITLASDIELTSTVTLGKAITVNIDFNGYQLNYTGSSGANASTAGFFLNNADATLNLNGSNKLQSYKDYIHYGEDVKPDMKGTGNLIAISHGALNINDAYLLSSSDAFVVFGLIAQNNNNVITISDSVLASPQNATVSALSSKGESQKYTHELIQRKLVVSDSVIYGGFYGGKVVPAIMAFHIPLYENQIAYQNRYNKDLVYEETGDRNEAICPSSYENNNMSGSATVTQVDGMGVGGSGAIEVTRSQTGNFEFYIDLGKENYAKLGSNKYLIVWVDFTGIDFRKACFGLVSNASGENSYRTDDCDKESPFYYMADDSSEWATLSHGNDGCFGIAQKGSINGYKGYLAIPVEYFQKGSDTLNEDSLITGMYMYADINNSSYANIPFYLDNIALVEDYLTYTLPTE